MNQKVSDELIEAGRGYERFFVPALFQPWTKHLVEGAPVVENSHVLDVACGTGVLARAALAVTGPGGRVAGADPAPGMIAAAKEIEPDIDWISCAAEALESNDESFDCIVSQFGMMFFQNRQKASDEMFRVLKPGGRLAIAVWNDLDHNPAYADIVGVLQTLVGTAAADALRLPYSMGNPDEVTSVLSNSGFADIRVETKIETARFPGSRHMVEAELRGWLPLFDIHLAENEITSILHEAEKALARYEGSGGEAVFPTSAHVITAGKP